MARNRGGANAESSRNYYYCTLWNSPCLGQGDKRRVALTDSRAHYSNSSFYVGTVGDIIVLMYSRVLETAFNSFVPHVVLSVVAQAGAAQTKSITCVCLVSRPQDMHEYVELCRATTRTGF